MDDSKRQKLTIDRIDFELAFSSHDSEEFHIDHVPYLRIRIRPKTMKIKKFGHFLQSSDIWR